MVIVHISTFVSRAVPILLIPHNRDPKTEHDRKENNRDSDEYIGKHHCLDQVPSGRIWAR
jgi:hypothetical protein